VFWHGQPAGIGHVVVGITPAELAQHGVEVIGLQRRSGA
jgi:hypothetical protein